MADTKPGNMYLELQSPATGKITFPAPPENIVYNRQSDWRHTSQPDSSQGGTPQYQGTQPTGLEAKFTLYRYAVDPPLDIERVKQILEKAVTPTEQSTNQGDPKAPLVTFGWEGSPVLENAFVTKIDYDDQAWDETTNKLRLTTVTIGLQAVPIAQPRQNPTSGGVATRRTHTVVAGDSLASIASAEYGNPAKWRALAMVNGIDDPMRLRPGTVLIVPEPSDADAFI